MTKNLALVRKQLDARFRKMKVPALHTRPKQGWIRAVRDALGMTSSQLATRLNVSQPRVIALEKGEVDGSVTLQSLLRAAEALNCSLIYALVPNEPLETMVRKQAERMATDLLKIVNHTMGLEDQAVSPTELKRQRQELIEDMLRNKPRQLWNEK